MLSWLVYFLIPSPPHTLSPTDIRAQRLLKLMIHFNLSNLSSNFP